MRNLYETKYIKMKNIITTLLLLLSVVSFSQTKVQLEVENNNGKEEYRLKLTSEVNGETVVIDKTYGSREEMKNDPELKDFDLHLMEGNGHSKEGEKQIVFKMDGNHKGEDHEMTFISEDGDGEEEIKIEVTVDEDGTKHIFKNGKEIELEDLHESGDNVFVFKSDGNNSELIEDSKEVEVTVDEDGAHHVTVNGEEVNYEEWKESHDSNTMMWTEEGEGGKHIKKEVIIITKDGEGSEGTMVEVIVSNIVLHLEDISVEDEKSFSLENNKELKLDEFNFYPNPSNGTFQLTFEGKERATNVKVTDINGKEMYFEDLQNFNGTYDKEINLSGLKKGIYLLQIVQSSKAVNKKIVIE